MIKYFSKVFITLLTLLLASCFDQSDSGQSQSSNSETSDKKSLINSSNWSGAKSAVNKITGIQISWDQPSVEASSYKVYRYSGKTLNLLATLSSSTNGYIDGSVTWGVLYSYTVRAIDKNGVEDSNTIKVTALSWAGISEATALSRSSIKVSFASPVAAIDEVRIYIQPASGGDKVLVSTAAGSDTEVTLSGLKTGYRYIISAQAYVSSLKKEDGNEASFNVATNTFGYHDEQSSVAKWLNVVNIRAFGASPAAPVHPTLPDKTPTTELVELSFKSFSGMDASAVYIVTRATLENELDTSIETPCETSTESSCRVKCSASSYTMSGVGILNCRDLKAAASPKKYRYTMSIQHSEGQEKWVEPIPQDSLENYSVIVPMPPANMVLIQRDAANYEMCGQMNAAVDPKNHNRCPYTGIGAVPYNSGPGKPPLSFINGFYDFGYNLFEDRFPMGCKWTRAVDGGKCGAGATTGNCIGYGATYSTPSNGIGVDGNVFFMLWPGESACYYKTGNVWVRSVFSNVTIPDPITTLGSIYSSNPSDNDGQIGVVNENASQMYAMSICNGQKDPHYGQKRIPRMREYRVFQAFPTIPGELYGMTYTQANTLNGGGKFNSVDGFRCQQNVSTNYTWPVDINSIFNPGNELMGIYTGGTYYGGSNFFLNSGANVDCQSRYGAQHLQTGAWGPVSDTFMWNSPTFTVTGTASVLDDGNRDLLADLNGGQTGYQMNYSTGTLSGTSYYQYSLSGSSFIYSISIPMGLPIFSSTATSYLSRLLFSENYGPAIYFPYTATPQYADRSVFAHSRWATYMTQAAVNGGINSHKRCVMSAE